MRSLVCLLTALACIAPSGAAAADVTAAGASIAPLPEESFISEADEIEIGREIAGRFVGAAPLVDDPELQRYVNAVGRWIASQSERPNLPWHFGVIDASAINAYSAPGGYVFVTRALYERLTDEAQLAAVLAQPIATIVRRHHITVAKKRAGLAAMMRLTMRGQAASRTPETAALLNNMIGFGWEIFAHGLDRDAILEADRMALVLTARAGYDAEALAEVLQEFHMLRPAPSDIGVLFSTHPPAAERLEKLHELMTASGSTRRDGKRPALRRPASIPASGLPPGDVSSQPPAR